MAALCISILSPVDLLPRGEIDVRRVPLLGIHNGETLSETPGLDELTWLRVLGRLLYAVADTRFKHCSRTLQVFSYRVSPEESRRPLASQQNSPGLFLKPETCCLKPRFAQRTQSFVQTALETFENTSFQAAPQHEVPRTRSRRSFGIYNRSPLHFEDMPRGSAAIQPVFSIPEETPEIESSRVFKTGSRSGAASGRARRRCRSVT